MLATHTKVRIQREASSGWERSKVFKTTTLMVLVQSSLSVTEACRNHAESFSAQMAPGSLLLHQKKSSANKRSDAVPPGAVVRILGVFTYTVCNISKKFREPTAEFLRHSIPHTARTRRIRLWTSALGEFLHPQSKSGLNYTQFQHLPETPRFLWAQAPRERPDVQEKRELWY